MSLYDMLFSRREGGDPTKVNIPVEPRTYGNPGFRERGSTNNSKRKLTHYRQYFNVLTDFRRRHFND